MKNEGVHHLMNDSQASRLQALTEKVKVAPLGIWTKNEIIEYYLTMPFSL
jgi:hypothetical protein